MTAQISQLENNGWIRDCAGPWGDLYINKFVQKLCVSYWSLNGVTRSFEFLIPRCSDSIEDLGYLYGKLFFISLDTCSVYHYIRVQESDHEKLAFFTFEGKKKCGVVMPFGPKNAPVFYTAMMKVLQNEWVVLFNATKYIVPSDTSLAKIFCDSKTIVDDTLIYSNHIPTLLHYFSCVAKVFTIYILSFKLSKYILHRKRQTFFDINGNCPAQSKFQFIKQLPLSSHDISLLSFIGLCSFYNNYVLQFESSITHLRRIQRLYHRQSFHQSLGRPSLLKSSKTAR